jgi:non-specific serine/threonine protein kinase
MLESVLQIVPEEDRGLTVATVMYGAGALAWSQGDNERARALYEESLALRRELGLSHRDSAGTLEGFAGLAGAQREARRGAHLLGAAEALREALGSPVLPNELADLRDIATASRTALGPAAYGAAIAEGRALTLDEAVAYALGEVTWDELEPVVAERLAAGEGDVVPVDSKAEPDRPERAGAT